MNVAVTGAQGFVGQATVATLTHAGHQVLPVVRASNDTFAYAYEWDIVRPSTKTFCEIEVVVHVAALVNDWEIYEKSKQVNVDGTQHVLDAFPNAKTFIYISSASVYDPTNPARVITEESPAGTHLLNAYSQTKFKGEQVVLHSSVPSRAVLRPHIVYGPGDTTVLPRLLKAQKLGRFLILGDGKNDISLTHIDNLTAAIVAITDSNKIFSGEIFNIVDKKSGTVEEIITTLKSELGIVARNLCIPKPLALFLGSLAQRLFRLFRTKRAPLVTPYLVEQMTSDHVLSIDKAQKILGYEPTVDYLTGFKQL